MPRQLQPAPLEAEEVESKHLTRELSSRYYIDHNHQDVSRNAVITDHTTLDLL